MFDLIFRIVQVKASSLASKSPKSTLILPLLEKWHWKLLKF